MTTPTLTIYAVGTPAPQGSKRAFRNPKTGRINQVESSKKVAPWRQDVTAAALNTLADTDWTQPAGPVEITICFHLARTKAHYRTGRLAHLLKDTAPHWVDKKPDLDKLARSTLDALTSSGAIRDDAQVARLIVEKRYAGDPVEASVQAMNPTPATGAEITITPLSPVPAAVPSPTGAAGTAPTSTQEALL